MYTYLVGKLITDLHSKIISVEGKNGLEVYRLMCNAIEPTPKNYEFYLSSQFTLMPQMYADKIKGLTELYAFRMLLKAKVASFKKSIGKEPDHGQLKQVLYVRMDTNSKNLASQTGLDQQSYTKIAEDIDRRYRLEYGIINFGKTAKEDDPMGLSNLSEAKWHSELTGENRSGEAASHPADEGRQPETGGVE